MQGPSWRLTTRCQEETTQKHGRHHSHVNDAPLHTNSFQGSSPKRKTAPEASRGAEERDAEEQGLPEATRCQRGRSCTWVLARPQLSVCLSIAAGVFWALQVAKLERAELGNTESVPPQRTSSGTWEVPGGCDEAQSKQKGQVRVTEQEGPHRRPGQAVAGTALGPTALWGGGGG